MRMEERGTSWNSWGKALKIWVHDDDNDDDDDDDDGGGGGGGGSGGGGGGDGGDDDDDDDDEHPVRSQYDKVLIYATYPTLL